MFTNSLTDHDYDQPFSETPFPGDIQDWWRVCGGNAHFKPGASIFLIFQPEHFLTRLITKNFSIQDICSTEPLAHVDFYPNGGLSQVLQTPEQSLENVDDDWWAGLRDRLMLLLQWRHCLWLLLPWFRFQNDGCFWYVPDWEFS